MYVLNYWHTVSDYDEWKRVFDSDPLGRQASGVRRYSIERPIGEEHTVIAHLEFESVGAAESFADRLHEVWSGLEEIVSYAGHNVTETLEQRDLGDQSARRAA